MRICIQSTEPLGFSPGHTHVHKHHDQLTGPSFAFFFFTSSQPLRMMSVDMTAASSVVRGLLEGKQRGDRLLYPSAVGGAMHPRETSRC